LKFGRKRHAIGWALTVITGITLVFAISWGMFYYGVIIPMQQAESASAGSGIYDSATYTFTTTVTGWWPFFVLLAELMWGWNQSTKRDLQEF